MRARDAGTFMRLIEGIARLICPNCARTGAAGWASDTGGMPRKLLSLSAGFLSIDTGAQDGPRIVCQKCRIRADEHSPE